jgi:pimeloyl-ACP methyl ester carboxylesterase
MQFNVSSPNKMLSRFISSTVAIIAVSAVSIQNTHAQVPNIVGRHDFVCPVGMAKRVHKGVRGSQLVIFEQTGHIPWIEEPSKFFALVTQFLQS